MSSRAQPSRSSTPSLIEVVSHRSVYPCTAPVRGRASAHETMKALCLVTLRAPPADPNARRPLYLVCILDRSGSMAGAKLKMLQATMNFMVQQLLPMDHVALVSYNSDVSVDLALTAMDEAGKQAACSAIATLRAAGSTNLDAGLDAALRVLADADMEKERVDSVMMLFTDGFANVGVRDHDTIIGRLTAAIARPSLGVYSSVSLYTFGFQNHDRALLFSLANSAHGCYYFISDASAIASAFADCLGALLSIVGQQAILRLEAKPGISIECVHTRFPVSPLCAKRGPGDELAEEARALALQESLHETKEVLEAPLVGGPGGGGGVYSKEKERIEGVKLAMVTLGDVIRDERRDILVTLRVADVSPSIAPIEAPALVCALMYTHAHTGEVGLHSTELALRRWDAPDRVANEGEVNTLVESHRLRLLVAEALDSAALESSKEAMARLAKMKTVVQASAAASLPMCRQLVQELTTCLAAVEARSFGANVCSGRAEAMGKGGRFLTGTNGQAALVAAAQQAVQGVGVLPAQTSGRSPSSSLNSPSRSIGKEGMVMSAGSVRQGDLILHEGCIVRVLRLTRSRAGKHGHAKMLFHLEDYMTKKHTQVIFPVHQTVTIVADPASLSRSLSSPQTSSAMGAGMAVGARTKDTVPREGIVLCAKLQNGMLVLWEHRVCRVTHVRCRHRGRKSHRFYEVSLEDHVTHVKTTLHNRKPDFPFPVATVKTSDPSDRYVPGDTSRPTEVRLFQGLEVLDVDHNGVTVMDNDAEYTVHDACVEVPAGPLGVELVRKFDAGVLLMVTICQANGSEAIVAVQEGDESKRDESKGDVALADALNANDEDEVGPI